MPTLIYLARLMYSSAHVDTALSTPVWDEAHGASFPADMFRRAMGGFATGVTVLTANDGGGGLHGMTANAFMSVSVEPPLVLVSVACSARLNEYLAVESEFGINVLAADQEALGRHFGGRQDKTLEVPVSWVDDIPLLDGSAAQYIARVQQIHPAGDHRLFLAKVQRLRYRPHNPLLFHGGQFKRF